MKTRIGFVSNSSSTSFIIYIPMKITAQQLTTMALDKIKGKTKEKLALKAAVKPLLLAFFKKVKAGEINDGEIDDLVNKFINEEDDAARDVFSDAKDTVLRPFALVIEDVDSDQGFYFNVGSPRAQKKIAAINAASKK